MFLTGARARERELALHPSYLGRSIVYSSSGTTKAGKEGKRMRVGRRDEVEQWGARMCVRRGIFNYFREKRLGSIFFFLFLWWARGAGSAGLMFKGRFRSEIKGIGEHFGITNF